jgi:hypothetical protein
MWRKRYSGLAYSLLRRYCCSSFLFSVLQSDGTIRFSTYDEKPVNPCNDFDKIFYSEEEQKGCNLTSKATSMIDIGLIYNDVWAYKLCNPQVPVGQTEPERGFDSACKETGWVLWHPGALQGGKLTVHGRHSESRVNG